MRNATNFVIEKILAHQAWAGVGVFIAIITLIVTIYPVDQAGDAVTQKNNQTSEHKNSPVVNTKGNVTININDNSKSESAVKKRFKVDSLYTEILMDYLGVSIMRIKQDFGEPYNEFDELEGTPGPGFISDDFKGFFYSFENGNLNFYVRKGKKSATVAGVFIKDNTKIKVPYLIDNGPGYPDIVLGQSKFKDLFSISAPRKSHSVSSRYEKYTETEFYFGGLGSYSTYSFGIMDYYASDIEDNHELLKDKTPNYVIIH